MCGFDPTLVNTMVCGCGSNRKWVSSEQFYSESLRVSLLSVIIWWLKYDVCETKWFNGPTADSSGFYRFFYFWSLIKTPLLFSNKILNKYMWRQLTDILHILRDLVRFQPHTLLRLSYFNSNLIWVWEELIWLVLIKCNFVIDFEF